MCVEIVKRWTAVHKHCIVSTFLVLYAYSFCHLCHIPSKSQWQSVSPLFCRDDRGMELPSYIYKPESLWKSPWCHPFAGHLMHNGHQTCTCLQVFLQTWILIRFPGQLFSPKFTCKQSCVHWRKKKVQFARYQVGTNTFEVNHWILSGYWH